MAIRGRYRSSWAFMAAGAVAALASWPASAAEPTAASQVTAARWHIVKLINQNGLLLTDVAAVRGGRAWVGGQYHNAAITRSGPLFYHWTGTKWIEILRPGENAENFVLSSLSASSDVNVWGTLTGPAAVDHWNGRTWTRVHFEGEEHSSAYCVAAVGRHQAWVFFSDGTASFFDGSKFTAAQHLPAPPYTVSAASSSDIWGWAIVPRPPYTLMAVHFNGTKWLKVKFPSALIANNGVPNQILAESPTNVWSTMPGRWTRPIDLVHWNGTKWQVVRGSHRPVGSLRGPITSDGDGGLWVYAEKGGAKFLVHYHNGTFTTQAVPVSPRGAFSVSGIAQIPGTRSLWGVGWGFLLFGGGAIIKYGP